MAKHVVGSVNDLGPQNFGGVSVQVPQPGGGLLNPLADASGALRKVEALEARVAQLERTVEGLQDTVYKLVRNEEGLL